MSNSISDSVDALFGAYVKFIASGDGQEMSDAIVVGDSYGVADYYIKEVNPQFIKQSDGKYIFLRAGKKTIYACCTYTTPNEEHIDTEGGPVLVKITTDDNADKAVEKIKVMYPYTDIEGNVVQFNKTFKPKKDGLSKGDRKGIVNILEYVFEKCPGIAGVKDYRILYNDSTDDEFEWETKIINSTTPRYWLKNKAYFAYGVISSSTSDTKIYKIYPNPVRIVEPGEEDLNSLKIKVDPTSVTLPYVAQSRAEVTVTSYRKDPWVATVDVDWITIEINEKRDKITITVAENKEYTSRTGYITLGYDDDDENATIKVIQTEFGIVFPEDGGDDNGGGDTSEITKVKYSPSSFGDKGTLSEQNNGPNSYTNTVLIFDDFDFSKANGNVWIEVPNVEVKQFDFIGLPDADYDNDIEIIYELRDINKNEIVGYTSTSRINSVGTYSCSDIVFTPTSGGIYELQATYTIYCDDPYNAGEQRVNYEFVSNNNGDFYYKYYE